MELGHGSLEGLGFEVHSYYRGVNNYLYYFGGPLLQL